ncbi:MAG: hypothetical protein V1743_04555 [Nanoarchaeota archaeon]
MSDMIFDFFSKVNKNSADRGATKALPKLEAVLHQNAQQQEVFTNQVVTNQQIVRHLSSEDLRKQNISDFRQRVLTNNPLAVQSHYDTPGTRPIVKNPAHVFPNSRTEEKRILEARRTEPAETATTNQAARPLLNSEKRIPTSPHPFPQAKITEGAGVDLSRMFNFGKRK